MLEQFPKLRSGGLLSAKTDLETAMSDLWRKWSKDFDVTGFPALDIKENDKSVSVEAELPGMDAKDVEIYMQDNSLVIKGEKKRKSEEKGENYHRVERSYGSFYRVVPMPCPVDKEGIKAKCKDGLLTVTLPKSKKEQAERIKIES